MPANSDYWKTGLKFSISIALLLILVASVDIKQFIDSTKSADRHALLLALVLFSLQCIFEGERLKLVFTDYGIKFRDGIRLSFIGIFFGNFMPGMLGSDVYQMHHMHKIRAGLVRPLSLSLFLRLTGLISNIVVGLVALSLSPNIGEMTISLHLEDVTLSPRLVTILLFILLITSVITLLFLRYNRLQGLIAKFFHLLHDFLQVATSFAIGSLTLISILGVFVILARASCFFVLALALGTPISSIDAIVVATVTALAMLLPISFAGLGVREASASAMLIAFGVPITESIAVSFISRCFLWVLSIIGGAWFLLQRTTTKATR